ALSLPLLRLTPRSICEPTALAAELMRVRREGVAVDDEESRLGLACVAAPVMGRSGRPVAAMSVSAPIGTDMRPLTASLRRGGASASQGISRSGLVRSAQALARHFFNVGIDLPDPIGFGDKQTQLDPRDFDVDNVAEP